MTVTVTNINEDQKEIARKSRSSFLYSFALLSKEKNDAMNTIYAFCRKTDDIVDSTDEPDEVKLSKIIEWRNELEKAMINGDSRFSLLNKLNAVKRKFNIPAEPFFDLIRGMEMDLEKNRYNTFGELAEYCFNVASTVGLMSIEVFGYSNQKTKDFAVNLGIALQLTNILRDIRQDAEYGRIYIPLEDMRKFGYTENDLINMKYDERFIELMKYECERAKAYYSKADSFLTKDDKGFMFAARIMQHIYFRLLKKIEKKNYNVFEGKVRVSKLKKLYIAAGVFLKYKLLYNSGQEAKIAMNGE